MPTDATSLTDTVNGAPSDPASGRPAAGFRCENKGRTTKRRADGAPFGRGADGAMEACTKEAQRRFHAVLAAAGESPVFITRRGRRRAVVLSARRFSIYEEALRACAENAAIAELLRALNAADGASDEASLQEAESALAAAKRLNRLLGARLASPLPGA